MTCGIYSILHIATGRYYVGQSRNIERRWKDHTYKSSRGHIGAALRKYGASAFTFAILEVCALDLLNSREVSWISHFDCVNPKGFNLENGGNTAKEISEVTRAKLRASVAGRDLSYLHTDAVRKKISLSHVGKILSPQHKEALSRAGKGRKLSASHKEAISAALLSSEKKKASIERGAMARRGRKHSKEWCEHIATGRTGILHSVEAKRKIGLAQLGRKHSPETKHKMSLARALFHKRKIVLDNKVALAPQTVYHPAQPNGEST